MSFRIKGSQADIVTCPQCQKRFSKTYSRTFACKGCSESYLTCGHVRCPHCGHEF
ncbi:MAG: hypothetical protein ACFFC7_16350 [Candidatus Hermodarchaeota archaeon]